MYCDRLDCADQIHLYLDLALQSCALPASFCGWVDLPDLCEGSGEVRSVLATSLSVGLV